MTAYTWNTLLTSGDWGVPSNWVDLGKPSTTTPGGNDSVRITNSPTITGSGEAAFLALGGALDLEGTFVLGSVDGGSQPYQVFYIGNDPDSSGSLTINGPSATTYSDINNTMIVGNSGGTGTLNIEGANVSVSDVWPDYFEVGGSPGSTGTVNVSGYGASLTTDYAYLGYDGGDAAISISSGGEFDLFDSLYAGEAGGNAEIVVDGVGSELIGTGLALGAAATAGTPAGSGTLDVTDGGKASIFSSVTLAGASLISVDATSTIEIGGGTNVNAGIIVVDAGYSISGSGEVDGDVENNGDIAATGGTLTLNGDVTGIGTMTINDLADLRLHGSLASTQTVEFTSSAVIVSDTLNIGELSGFGAPIGGFQNGDTIDLDGVVANDAVFNSNTGIVKLYEEQWGTGDNATLVGTLAFDGYSSAASFALASDGDGGTDVTFGAPVPGVVTLANLANAAYTPGLGVGIYNYVTDYVGSAGFLAEEFKDGNQIVVAIRGTDHSSLGTFVLNLVADASWATNSPNSTLATEVGDAAYFLEQVRLANPTDNITVTGHSLGGAVAQLLGLASDYSATGFDAPGAERFYGGLLPSDLQLAYLVRDGITSRTNDNYRASGDQVSLAGTAIGPQFTVTSLYPDDWADALNNHSIAMLANQMSLVGQPNSNLAITPGVPDAKLTLADLATETLLSTLPGRVIYTITAAVGAIGHYYGFDPSGDGTYELTGSQSSPPFSSVLLPAATGVSTYIASFLQDGTWTADQTITPGATISVPTGDPVTGVSFTPEDSSQNTVVLPNGFVFEAAFASTGTFDGTLSETVACFLPGTHILTNQGETLVEKLRVGDIIITLSGRTRRLCWIGCGRTLATRGRRTAATPIVVRKGALADNTPNRDLHITKGHSLYIDGVLIPVEFLVNHRSILWDDRAQEVTVFHLELDKHDVLLANGAPAESYRDDGNRWLFQNANTGWHLSPKSPYAPVLTGGPIVDMVWRRLLDRAGSRPGVPLTDDPDLHLLVDGIRLDATARTDEFYVFDLQGAPTEMRVVSLTAVPQEIGLARDPRSLGVGVRRIVVRQGSRFRTFQANDTEMTNGFHTFEAENRFRWTDGNAILPPKMFVGLIGSFEVVLHVGGRMQYMEGAASARAA